MMTKLSRSVLLTCLALLLGSAGLRLACAETEPKDVYTTEPIVALAEPGSGWARKVRVGEVHFIYQPARSVWGYGTGSVSDLGAVWLGVTYTTGVSHGGGPIEEPHVIKQ